MEALMGSRRISVATSAVIFALAASAAVADQSGGIPALTDRIATLEGETAALKSAVAGLQAQLTAVEQRLASVHTRKTDASVAANSFAFVDSPCGQGEQVLGGGHESFVALASAIAPQIWDSVPALADDGTTQVWRVGVENDNAAPMAFAVYALCLAR
jgi:hypothetical protein